MQLRKVLWFKLLMLWSCAAFAAQATFANDLAAIPPAAIAISVLLSVIGGAAYTAQKIADPSITVKSNLLEIIKDTLTSVVVGLLIFFMGSYWQLASVLLAGLITLGGYGGSRVLEPALARLIDSIKSGKGADAGGVK